MLSFDKTMPVNGQEPASGAPVPAASSKTSSSAKTPSDARANNGHAQKHHIWLVTGPAGSGKTTVAEYLAKALDVPYVEGDSYHTEANVEKMRTGIPLTDADRWDWLAALRDESMQRLNRGSEGVVVTCSALKRKYRDVIRVAAYYDPDVLIHFIFLSAPVEVLLQRVTHREGHYMGANMVKSQFDILEQPAHDERDVIVVDVSRDMDEVKRDALAMISDITKADH